ncbi:MAG: DUF4838 domain-containing protein [Ruminococcaceae bacterium]|nr:DUF4838 domain-containing protein [Oscillospiraceae bacterium]
MSQNNSFGKIRWYSCIAFFLAFCLTLAPLAWIIVRERDNLFGQTTAPTIHTPPPEKTPEVSTPEETTPPEVTTPEETTPSDSFVAYTVTVVNKNNAPLAGATVQLCVGNKNLIPILTNTDGVVTILADEADYTVSVTLEGYVGQSALRFENGSTELKVVLAEKTWFVLPPYNGDGITDENVLKRAYIITGESESEIYAGEELAAYLTKKNVKVAEGGFPMILFVDPTLGDDAFSIDVTLRGEEASMTIRGGNGRGVLYGVYKFLERYAGVRYFTYELERIPESDITLFDGNMLAYEPYFEYRHTSWHCAAISDACSWCVKSGLNGNGHIPSVLGGKVGFGPGLNVHTLGKLTETGNGLSPNPCLSLDSPEGLANFEKTMKNLRAALETDPTINIVSVSQNDNNNYCKCDYCMASYAYYTNDTNNIENGGTAGNLLAFVNAVAKELEDEYPNLIVDTLAYNYTQAPPKNIVPNHNVCIRVCSIRVCFMHPFTECPDAKGPNGVQWTRTAQFRTDFINWGKIWDRIYVWDYTTNFAYYIAPFSNFGAIRENMLFYYENGVRGMFEQGNSQSPSGEFGELRAYLLAKLMWNPYMSEEEYYQHMDEFLEAYYGEGWEGIRAFIDLTIELAGNEGSCINIYEAPLNSISEAEYLEHEADIEAWWNNAEALAGDRLEYVQRSRLQWRYIQLLLHPDDEACAQFVEDVKAYGIRWAESDKNNKPLNEMFTNLYPVGGETGGGPQDGEDPVNPQ